jgi:PE-PPE domain
VALAGSHRPPLLSNQHGYAATSPTDPTAIVTTSGNLTDVLIPSPVGQLPLTQPLLNLGVPQAFVTAIDPFLRAVIMTAYRPTDDPAQRVTFQLRPPASAWGPNIASIAAGAAESAQLLKKAVRESRPVPTPPVDQPELARVLNSGLPVSISSVPSPLNTQTPSVNASTTSPTHLTVANIAEPPASAPQSTTNPDVTVAPKAQEPDAQTGDEQPISDPNVGSGTHSRATTAPSLSTLIAKKPSLPRVHLSIGSDLRHRTVTRPSPDRPMRSVLNGLKRDAKASTASSDSSSANSRESSDNTRAVR